MAKIYTIRKDEGVLINLIEKKLNNNEPLKALLISDTLLGLEEYNAPNAHALRARIFYKMKRYSSACFEWFLYLSTSKNQNSYARAYNGLGACFYKMQDLSVAGYYFNRQIMADKKAVFEYSSVTKEFYEEIVSVKNHYYLAYPFEKADFSHAFSKVEEYQRLNQHQKALDILKDVPVTSKQYKDALTLSSVSKYLNGDSEGAIEDVKKAISLKKNAITICNAISMLNATNRLEDVDYFLELLDGVKVETEEELYKVAMVNAELKRDEIAKKYAIKYLKINPYDTTMLLVLGMINYNLKLFDEAEKYLIKAYQINRCEVNKFYLDYIKRKDFNLIQYSFDIPYTTRLEIVNKISDYLKLNESELLEVQEDIYNISNYAFSTPYYQMQSSAVTLLGQLNTKKAVELMKNSLLNLTAYDRVKSGVVGFLVASGYEGELSVVYGNIYKTITVYKANFEENSTFIEAYAYAVSKLSPMEKNFLPIKESGEKIYNALKKNGLLSTVSDVRSLSAVMYELSNISNIKSRREFSKFFGANLIEIKSIKEKIVDFS